MRSDPKPKLVDGELVCAVCGSPLNDLATAAGDPFCKTACANEFHGFDPATRAYTLSGHPAGYRGQPRTPLWDDGARHKRKREATT